MEIVVEAEHVGKRVDILLTFFVKSLSRSQIKQHIMDGYLVVNGQKCIATNYRVDLNDKITFEYPETQSINEIKEWEYKIEVAYEDKNLLIVNKPIDIKSHPSNPQETNTILNATYSYLKQTEEKPYLKLMNRLDRPTSGLIIFAKRPEYTNLLSQANNIQKYYLAVVSGNVLERIGDKFFITKNLRYNERLKKQEPNKDGDFAETEVEFLDYNEEMNLSLLKANIRTGRKHQIRVHLSSLGFPILGDDRYGGRAFERLMLHSWVLKIKDLPGYDKELVITASLPKEFTKLFSFTNQ